MCHSPAPTSCTFIFWLRSRSKNRPVGGQQLCNYLERVNLLGIWLRLIPHEEHRCLLAIDGRVGRSSEDRLGSILRHINVHWSQLRKCQLDDGCCLVRIVLTWDVAHVEDMYL